MILNDHGEAEPGKSLRVRDGIGSRFVVRRTHEHNRFRSVGANRSINVRGEADAITHRNEYYSLTLHLPEDFLGSWNRCEPAVDDGGRIEGVRRQRCAAHRDDRSKEGYLLLD